jgi:Flp pilus assembly secretin CpaC
MRGFLVAVGFVLGTVAHVDAQVDSLPGQSQPPQSFESQPAVAQPPAIAQPHAPAAAPPVVQSAPIDVTGRPQPSPYYAPAVADATLAQPPSDKEQLAKKLDELHNLQQEVNRLRQATGTPSQVLVKLQMVEISRTKLRALGFDFEDISDHGLTQSSISEILAKAASSPGAAKTKGAMPASSGIVDDSNALRGFLDALRREHVAKVLAEPSIVTSIGQPSSFTSGGEFPLFIGSSQDSSPIQYMKFGTEVELVPMALGDERLRLRLRFRVSEIDEGHGVTIKGGSVPRLRCCAVQTAIEMKLGQTMILHVGTMTRREVEKRLAEPGSPAERARETVEDLEALVLVTPEAIDGPLDVSKGTAATCDPVPADDAALAEGVTPRGATTAQPTSSQFAPDSEPIRSSARRIHVVPFGPVAKIARVLSVPHPGPQDRADTDTAVSLQLRVIDIDLAKMRQEGLEFKHADGRKFKGPDGIFLVDGGAGDFSKSASDVLDALIKRGIAQVVSRPQLLTLSGQLAQVRVGCDVDVPDLGHPGKIGKNFAGTDLEVLPQVNSEGRIELKFKLEISQKGEPYAYKIDDHPAYAVRRMIAKSTLSLDDGQTIIAGGMRTRSATQTTGQGTPENDFNDENNGAVETAAAAGSKVDETSRYVLVTARIVRPALSKEPATLGTKVHANPTTDTPREANLHSLPGTAEPK